MNETEGETAVRIARQAVESETRGAGSGNVDAPASFREKRGVFVTLHSYPSHLLRGCIGFPEPAFSLASALLQAGQAVCHDPRFDDLQIDELDSVTVEVSVLTPPQEIKVEDKRTIPSLINVGEDGLIVEMAGYRGLLLPQVPIEWDWDAKEFLDQTFLKAGIDPEYLTDKRSRVFKFQGEIYSEGTPNGKIVRKELK